MTISVKHKFTSLKGDGADATLIRPSNWNDTHDLQMATANILGRLSAGPGAVEEIPATAYMLGLLAKTDYLALAAVLGLPTTGDARLTFKTTADAGWVLANDGSIGNGASGATTRANADTQALFVFFYNTYPDSSCPIQTGSGAATTRAAQGTATTAYAANCRMVLPRTLGRAIVVGSPVGAAGSGLSVRWTTNFGGEENHVLTAAELASHTHTLTPSGSISNTDINHTHTQAGTFGSTNTDINHTHQQAGTFLSGYSADSTNHTHNYNALTGLGAGGGGPFGWASQTATGTTGTNIDAHRHYTTISGGTGYMDQSNPHGHNTTISGATGFMNSNNVHGHTFTGTANIVSSTTGSDAGHNNMMPWTGITVMIRL